MSHRLTEVVVAVVVAAGVVLSGCSDPKPSPDQERRDRVEARLQSTFSDAEAGCILDRLDPTTLRAVDRTASLGRDTEALATYSDAVAACVADPEAPQGTTTTGG